MRIAGDGVGQIVADEARRFIGKDPSQLKLVAGLYAVSAIKPELGKVARASYFFMRHLDDLLDGEMSGIADPLGYAEDLKDQVTTRQFKAAPRIGHLAAYALPVLEKRGRPDDNPTADFVQLIDAMVFDYHRRQDRRVLTTDELAGYYHEVIDPGTNLMLIGTKSSLRVDDLPDFSPNLGRLYSIRDIQKDWRLGFINIPSEVLTEAKLNNEVPLATIVERPDMQEWFESEVTDAKTRLQTTRLALPSNEWSARLAIGGFISQASHVQVPTME